VQEALATAREWEASSRGKVWSREHNKNPVAEAGMEVEMLAGHARALKQEEVL
jgi:hypothetical protein